MKTFLKVILILLGIIVLVGLVMGLTGPKSYQVERTAVITGPPEVVWPYTSSAKLFQDWSPFRKMDTTATVEFFGDDMVVGSGFNWEGKKSGKGTMTFSTLEHAKTSNTHLVFVTPFGKMESDSYMHLEPDEGGTKLTWGVKGENNFIGKIMHSLGDMDKQMGPVFEEGLADLDSLVTLRSSGRASASAYNIEHSEFSGATYLGVRGDVKMVDIGAFYEKNLPLVMGAVEKAGGKVAGMPVGLYYTWDLEKGVSHMVAGIPVEGSVNAPANMEVVTVDAGKVAVINYMGGYHGLGDVHMAMEQHFKLNGMEQGAPVIEEYITDPGTEPDSNNWITKVTYFVK